MALLSKSPHANLLTRILDDPNLPEKIRLLDPSALLQLINEIGLEDCAEIIGCASLGQLEQVFDEDLWCPPTPGSDEEFDPKRFGLWLEVLLELGQDPAANKLADMDPDFLTAALSQLIWVIDLEWLEGYCSIDHRIEKILESIYYFEIEEFLIFAREAQSWDAVVAIITELDQSHHSFIRRILERCAHLSTEQIEDSHGLYDVLTSEQQIMEDLAAEREQRREAKGYVTPADARAFLKLASNSAAAEDHVSPRHLRKRPSSDPKSSEQALSTIGMGSALIQVEDTFPRVRTLLQSDEVLKPQRMEQLLYLANVLMSGGDRSFRPGEAIRLVLETCEKGLSLCPDSDSFLSAFRTGWSKKSGE